MLISQSRSPQESWGVDRNRPLLLSSSCGLHLSPTLFPDPLSHLTPASPARRASCLTLPYVHLTLAPPYLTPTLPHSRYMTQLSMVVRFESPTSMAAVPLPELFVQSTTGFSWASLSFNLLGSSAAGSERRLQLEEAFDEAPSDRDSGSLSPAQIYLAGVGQSAEGLFVSTCLVQASAQGFNL